MFLGGDDPKERKKNTLFGDAIDLTSATPPPIAFSL